MLLCLDVKQLFFKLATQRPLSKGFLTQAALRKKREEPEDGCAAHQTAR